MNPSPKFLIATSIVALLVVSSASKADAQEAAGGMNSPGLFGAGLFLSGAGAVGLGVGGYFFSSGSGACDGVSTTTVPSIGQIETCKTGIIEQVGGTVGMVTGGAFLLVGVPMMIVGGTSADDDAPQVSVSVGPSRASLTLSF